MELRSYFNMITKWLWLVILCGAAAAVAAFLISRQQTPVYQATSTVYINQARSTTGRSDYTDIITSERVARTYSQMLQDWPTVQQAISDLGYVNGLRDIQRAFGLQVAVNPVRDTQLVKLSVQSSNAELAAQLANTLPEVFMRMNRDQQRQRFAVTRGDLQAELAKAESVLETTGKSLDELPETEANKNERDQLERLLARYQTTYGNLSKSLEDLRLAEVQNTDNIVLTTPALTPTSPIRPRVLFNTLLAVVVGAMLALGIIFLIEYLDDTIKTPDQVRDLSGLPTLGAVALIEGSTPQQRFVALMSPKSAASEAYRVLRTNLQFSSLDEPLRSLVVTSPSPGEGKSTTAANLAAVIAQTGQRVVLVDGDLRRPSVHRLFQLPNNTGLTTSLLHHGENLSDYLLETNIPGLSVMTTGPIPPNPAELLGSGRMRELIMHLQEQADFVILDSPPVLAVTDAAILSNQVGGTLLVVGCGDTRDELFKQALERLDSAGVRPIGVVLNKLTERKTGYYYYSYYYTGRYYGPDDDHKGDKGKRRGRRSSGRSSIPQKTSEQSP